MHTNCDCKSYSWVDSGKTCVLYSLSTIAMREQSQATYDIMASTFSDVSCSAPAPAPICGQKGGVNPYFVSGQSDASSLSSCNAGSDGVSFAFGEGACWLFKGTVARVDPPVDTLADYYDITCGCGYQGPSTADAQNASQGSPSTQIDENGCSAACTSQLGLAASFDKSTGACQCYSAIVKDMNIAFDGSSFKRWLDSSCSVPAPVQTPQGN